MTSPTTTRPSTSADLLANDALTLDARAQNKVDQLQAELDRRVIELEQSKIENAALTLRLERLGVRYQVSEAELGFGFGRAPYRIPRESDLRQFKYPSILAKQDAWHKKRLLEAQTRQARVLHDVEEGAGGRVEQDKSKEKEKEKETGKQKEESKGEENRKGKRKAREEEKGNEGGKGNGTESAGHDEELSDNQQPQRNRRRVAFVDSNGAGPSGWYPTPTSDIFSPAAQDPPPSIQQPALSSPILGPISETVLEPIPEPIPEPIMAVSVAQTPVISPVTQDLPESGECQALPSPLRTVEPEDTSEETIPTVSNSLKSFLPFTLLLSTVVAIYIEQSMLINHLQTLDVSRARIELLQSQLSDATHRLEESEVKFKVLLSESEALLNSIIDREGEHEALLKGTPDSITGILASRVTSHPMRAAEVTDERCSSEVQTDEGRKMGEGKRLREAEMSEVYVAEEEGNHKEKLKKKRMRRERREKKWKNQEAAREKEMEKEMENAKEKEKEKKKRKKRTSRKDQRETEREKEKGKEKEFDFCLGHRN